MFSFTAKLTLARVLVNTAGNRSSQVSVDKEQISPEDTNWAFSQDILFT